MKNELVAILTTSGLQIVGVLVDQKQDKVFLKKPLLIGQNEKGVMLGSVPIWKDVIEVPFYVYSLIHAPIPVKDPHIQDAYARATSSVLVAKPTEFSEVLSKIKNKKGGKKL